MRIGDIDLTPEYAGPQATYPGLDQVNVELPLALTGRGEVTVSVIVDGVASNAVTLQMQ